MKPLPWSHSLLEAFVNCGRAFYEIKVAKRIKEQKGEEAKWGDWVHKQFQERLSDGVVLHPDLEDHEPFMAFLQAKPGTTTTEQKFALDRKLRPCEFFARDVWFRGIIDYKKVHGEYALVVDYKTGKVHSKFRQLKLFALYVFYEHPEVNLVNAQYYWTTTKETTKRVYGRKDIPALWGDVMPDLKQYVEAFRTETWQPRQSGLCKKHCPVLSCEFNGRR